MVRHNGIEIYFRRRTVSYAGRSMHFAQYPRFKLVVTLILAGPKTAEELFDFIYAHRDDGGPEYGAKQIAIFLSQIRDVVREIGLEIIVGRQGESVNRYALVPIGELYPGWRVYGRDARARSISAAYAARRENQT